MAAPRQRRRPRNPLDDMTPEQLQVQLILGVLWPMYERLEREEPEFIEELKARARQEREAS